MTVQNPAKPPNFCLFDDFEFQRIHVYPDFAAAIKYEGCVNVLGIVGDGAGDGERRTIAGAFQGFVSGQLVFDNNG